jgi:beta-glucosidase
LSAADVGLIEKAKAAGAPVVTLILSGRPLILGPELDATDALVAAWLPGTEGQGVADVLFGDYKPTGKLPRHWPRDASQLTGYSIDMANPLFARGFGLTYK